MSEKNLLEYNQSMINIAQKNKNEIVKVMENIFGKENVLSDYESTYAYSTY